jgi:hypothetical protein
MVQLDTSDAGQECQGSYDGMVWTTPGRYQSFAPIKDNNTDIIFSVTQTFCQLLSFSILDPEDRATPCVDNLPRCMPGSTDCLYKKLPDSLCPENDGDRANWRCHLGAKGNINDEVDYPADDALNCTMEDRERSAGVQRLPHRERVRGRGRRDHRRTAQ